MGEVILVVDDEDPVRSLVRRVLARRGYRLIEARDCEEARRVAAAWPAEIDVLLTDVKLPDCTGPDLYEEIRTMRPTIRPVFMTGLTEFTADAPVLLKPFTLEQLAASIHAALQGGTDPAP